MPISHRQENPVSETASALTTASPAAQTAGIGAHQTAHATVFSVLAAISLCHLLNDLMQALLPAM